MNSESKTIAKKDQKGLVFLPLGGVEQVGLNASLYGYGRRGDRNWIMVDCGLGFTGDRFPGIDVCLPDIDFVEKEGKRIKALFITHAHEDHIGALGYYADQIRCPVYVTPFARALFEAKWPDVNKLKLITVKEEQPITVGDFTVRYLPVIHSIPESNALLIESPEGRIFHSGDWKLDAGRSEDFGEMESRFRDWGDKGIDVLVCDSTNAPSQGYSPTEDEVEQTLIKLISEAKGLVGITLFASNVRRLNAIARAAQASGRSLVTLGRAVERTIDVACDCGYFLENVKVYGRNALESMPRGKAVVIFSGSQGESNAALARSAAGTYPGFSFEAGDRMIFSSRSIPGNEVSIGTIINELMKQQVEVITDKQALVHVSGHPRQNELSRLYEWLRPQKLVTVHGEPQHLYAQKFWATKKVKQTFVPENGDILRLAPGAMKKEGAIETGQILVDGRMTYHERAPFAAARRKLSHAGILIISLIVDGKGKLAGDVYMEAVGIPSDLYNGRKTLDDEVFDALMAAFQTMKPRERLDPERLEWRMKRAAQGVFRMNWDKKPVIKMAVHYLSEGGKR